MFTKLSEASQLTATGSVSKPNRRMIAVGIAVEAFTRITPASGLVITGVKACAPYCPCGKLNVKNSCPVLRTVSLRESFFITRRAASEAASQALCILLFAI